MGGGMPRSWDLLICWRAAWEDVDGGERIVTRVGTTRISDESGKQRIRGKKVKRRIGIRFNQQWTQRMGAARAIREESDEAGGAVVGIPCARRAVNEELFFRGSQTSPCVGWDENWRVLGATE